MPLMTKISKIRELLSQNEGPKLDFKQHLSLATDRDKIEFTKDVCAIANTSNGHGYIIIGIEDKTKRVLGINPSSIDEARLQQIVSSRSDPPPRFSVEFAHFKGTNLAIVYIPRRRLATLHQVKRVGFPIRRGSTTDIMTTNEIFTVVQTHARRTRSKASEYEVFSSHERNRTMRQDTLKGLLELGFSPKETKEIQQANAMFVSTTKTINRRKTKLYFHFCSENADKYYIARLQHLLDDLVDKIPRHRTIFISIIHGSLSTALLRRIIRDWGSLTLTPISPSITYFGVGTGVVKSRYYSPLGQPRFYVHKVKSKEDIKARIQVILGWIEQQEDLFSQIYSSFRR